MNIQTNKIILLVGLMGSGKTSVLEKINQVYSSKGYKVIIVPETATELMNNGISFRVIFFSILYYNYLRVRTMLLQPL